MLNNCVIHCTACQFFAATFLTVGYFRRSVLPLGHNVSTFTQVVISLLFRRESWFWLVDLYGALFLTRRNSFLDLHFQRKNIKTFEWNIKSTINQLIERFSGNHFMTLLQTMWDSLWVILNNTRVSLTSTLVSLTSTLVTLNSILVSLH